MRKDIAVIEASDLLSYAQELGTPWNKAHDLLFRQDRLLENDYPDEIHLDELDEYGWSKETKEILKGYMEKEKLDKFLLVR